jgi:hypothetical protein
MLFLNMRLILIYDMQFIGELNMMNILLTQDLRVFICSLF